MTVKANIFLSKMERQASRNANLFFDATSACPSMVAFLLPATDPMMADPAYIGPTASIIAATIMSALCIILMTILLCDALRRL